MPSSISSNIWSVLTCGYCGKGLETSNHGAVCPNCSAEYGYTHTDSLDLRLNKPKKYGLEFELGTVLSENELTIEPLVTHTHPEVDFSNMDVPHHLTKELLSYFPKAKSSNSLMLDLGCGDAIHRDVCERAGFEWVGLDHDSSKAPLLGDAHALPFKNESFEFILSIAVLEHIRYPFVMMREAYRVLKPHGKFIGTVSFLEPFHGDSFYHHTHLGTLNSLRYGGFTIEKLAPSEKWSVLMAQANMVLFPRMPRFMSQSIVYPVHLLHKLWWQAGNLVTRKSNSQTRVRNTTGAFTFIAVKNPD